MSREAWGDENPDDAYADSWMDRASDAGWIDPTDYSPGAVAILKERERQEIVEGYTPDNDDRHIRGELATAAGLYTLPPRIRIQANLVKLLWPATWSLDFWKPKDRRQDLVRAGALIAAEIDRMDRLETHPY